MVSGTTAGLSATTDTEANPPAAEVLSGQPRRWALIVLICGLLLTAAGTHVQRTGDLRALQQRAERAAERNADSLSQRLHDAGALLRALQTLYHTGATYTQPEFEQAVANLRQTMPLPSLVAAVHARALPTAKGVGRRYVYDLAAPRAGNERSLGFDTSLQPANLIAQLQARNTDQPVMSGPIRLQQPAFSPVDAVGVAIRLPIYAQHHVTPNLMSRDVMQRDVMQSDVLQRDEVGALAASFRLRPLISSALLPDTLDIFRVRVSDVTERRPMLLFDTHASTADADIVHTSEFDYGNRRWQLALSPLREQMSNDAMWFIVFGGTLASVLSALLIWSLAVTRSRAVALGLQFSARYRESEERFRALNELLPALVLLAHADSGVITYANRAARTHLALQEGVDVELQSLFDGDVVPSELCAQRGHADRHAGEWNSIEAVLRSTHGRRFWANLSLTPVNVGGAEQWLLVASDVSEQRQLTELLSFQATHDALTELYNRREFERRIERALLHMTDKGGRAALIYLDLDQFKLINDTSGHVAGDQLLIQLSGAMRDELRGNDVLARLGGDEFGVLISNVNEEGVLHMAERLRNCIQDNVFVWDRRTYVVTASIGVAMLDRSNATLGDALSAADTACYVAKENGRNRVHIYRDQDDQTSQRRGEMDWANRLRWAMDDDRLRLFYQELHPLHGNESGPQIELLLRLLGEDDQLVTPGAFLPAAERFGLMPMIDRWVIRTALANFNTLHPSGAALARCSINLSGASLEDETLADYILQLIKHHKIDPQRLCFEITETVAVRNLGRVVQFIERLRDAGCLVALDDFGVGMSSFGYLKNLPIDLIKIDGSFIRDLVSDTTSQSIVRAITEIGNQLGLKVVAEWVSEASLIDLLRGLGVDYAQGYAIHRPQAVERRASTTSASAA